MKNHQRFLVLLACCAFSAAAAAQQLERNILGLDPRMTRADVDKRLHAIGVFERDERKHQQVWKLREHPSFSVRKI